MEDNFVQDMQDEPIDEQQGGLPVTGEMYHFWSGIAGWARFNSIATIIMVGIFFLFVVVAGAVSQALLPMAAALSDESSSSLISLFINYLILFLLIILGGVVAIQYFQLRFSGLLKRSMRMSNQELFEKAWLSLVWSFRASGIFIGIVIVLVLILALVSQTVQPGTFPTE
jgi:hypothetical protein